MIGIVLLIWLYTRRSGIRTIVWTDSLQTLCLLLALGLILYEVSGQLKLDFPGLVHAIRENEHSRIFVFDDWHSKQNFFKQIFSGIFITIVMTGLDQDMMQRNLSCKNFRDSQKNMIVANFMQIFVIGLFLVLGTLLYMYADRNGIHTEKPDALFGAIAWSDGFPIIIGILFILGLIAASSSAAGSALTAMTT